MGYLTTQHGTSKQVNTPLLIPLELELDIDGIGGIYPGNSYHSTYVPSRYQKNTVFQCFDVNHRLDSSGWTVTLAGKMRATLNSVLDMGVNDKQKIQLDNYLRKAKDDEIKKLKSTVTVLRNEIKTGKYLKKTKEKYREQVRQNERRITYLQK